MNINVVLHAGSMNRYHHGESPCATQTAPAAQMAQQLDVSDVACTSVIPGGGNTTRILTFNLRLMLEFVVRRVYFP